MGTWSPNRGLGCHVAGVGHVEEVIDQPLPPAGQGVEGGVCVEGAEERRRCHMSEGRDGQTQAKVKPGSLGL